MRGPESCGPPNLCAWQVVPGVFWIQTTDPRFSRKLEKREDARRIEVIGVNHFRRTFELRGRRRKIQRIIDRYLVSAGDRFLDQNATASASEMRGRLAMAENADRGAKGVLNGEVRAA